MDGRQRFECPRHRRGKSFNFTSHSATTGMGPVGPGPESGFLLHSALALATDGVPLGLAAQIAWARDPETRGKSADRKLPIEDKAANADTDNCKCFVGGGPASCQGTEFGLQHFSERAQACARSRLWETVPAVGADLVGWHYPAPLKHDRPIRW